LWKMHYQVKGNKPTKKKRVVLKGRRRAGRYLATHGRRKKEDASHKEVATATRGQDRQGKESRHFLPCSLECKRPYSHLHRKGEKKKRSKTSCI